MMRMAMCTALLVCTVAACNKSGRAATSDSTLQSTPGTISASANPDTDLTARGAGLPRGYVAQFDKADAKPTDASYTADGNGRWEVRTGAAHILYNLADTAQGSYTVSATFEQLEKPKHPEAYGVFIGGSTLDQPANRHYTYFLVRGNGQYLVKVRDGDATRTITDWTSNSAVPHEDSTGKALYGIKIDVSGGTAKVSVNGQPVTTFTAKDGPLDGVTGVRINHNLHVMVTPVAVTHR
jgi:hypothetical protein